MFKMIKVTHLETRSCWLWEKENLLPAWGLQPTVNFYIVFFYIFSCPDRVCGQLNRWHCHWLTEPLLILEHMTLNVRKLPKRLSLTILKNVDNFFFKFFKFLTILTIFDNVWQVWHLLKSFTMFDNFYNPENLLICLTILTFFWQFYIYGQFWQFRQFFNFLTVLTLLTIFDNFDNETLITILTIENLNSWQSLWPDN